MENSSYESIPCYQRSWLEIKGKGQMQPAWQDAGFFSDDYSTQADQMVPIYSAAGARRQLKFN